MTQAGMFDARTYAKTRLPLHQASPLPGWCYTSPEWYRREIDTMFARDWLCIARLEQVPAPGDYFSIEVTGKPLVVVRDEGGRIRVFSALCRHRGAIITEGSGNCRALVCPYHSWTYALDGRLVNTPGNPPPMAGVEGFDTAAFGLDEVRSDTWGGFVFATFDANAEPLRTWLGDLPAFVANYRFEDLQWTHRDEFVVECNWKVWLENALENYHVPTIHRSHHDPARPQNWTFERTNGPWEAMYSKRSIVAYSGLPTIEGLAPHQAGGLYHIWLKPGTQLIVNASYLKYRQYLPLGPGRLRLYENWAFPRTTVASPQFAEVVGPDYYVKYSQIIREDMDINPNVQRAMSSGSFRPGRYSLEEFLIHRIANHVIDRVVGPDDPASRAAREAAADAMTA